MKINTAIIDNSLKEKGHTWWYQNDT